MKNVIICGDLNVAHKNIDVYDPEGKEDKPGFIQKEREEFDKFLK